MTAPEVPATGGILSSVAAGASALNEIDAAADKAAAEAKQTPEEKAAAETAATEKAAADKAAVDAKAAEAAAAEGEETQEAAEGAEPTAEEKAAAEAAAAAKPETRIAKVGDEEIPVTFDEAVKGFQRQADYTKKTQALAAERERVAAVEQQTAARRDEYLKGLETLEEALEALLPPEPDWDKVRAEKPEEYPQRFADFQLTQKRLGDFRAEKNRVAQAQFADRMKAQEARVAGETEKFIAAVPEFADPVKGKPFRASMYEYGRSLGFTDTEINSTADHRLLVTLNKARLYDSLQAQKAAALKKLPVPAAPATGKRAPAMAPGAGAVRGAPNATKTKVAEAAKARLESEGSVDAATAALNALDDL